VVVKSASWRASTARPATSSSPREIYDLFFEVCLYDDSRDAYPRVRPHGSLGYLALAVFAAALINPEPSLRADH
jgi:hypothetical protein